MSQLKQGDALIYKDSEFLDFDNTIFVENTEDTPNGTLVTLSNGQTMFSTEVNKKFRKATESEVNRSNIMSKELFARGGNSPMKKYSDGGNADDFDLSSIISDFGLEDIIDDIEKKSSEPKKTKRIVSKKSGDKKVFGDFVFADDDPSRVSYALRDVSQQFIKEQGNNKEANTPEETRMLFLLKKWVDVVGESEYIAESKPLLEKLREQYPEYFAPSNPNGTLMFRGLSKVSDSSLNELRKMKLSDFAIYQEETSYYGYSDEDKKQFVLCKKPIDYVPTKEIQSWTPVLKSAQGFYGRGMLVTKQDDDFFINEDTLEKLYGSDENENIHIGKKFKNNVYLALRYDYFTSNVVPFLFKNEKANESFVEASEKLKFADGGNTKTRMKKIKRGGITYGKSHAEGGIPVKNQSTGDMLEVEGGEGIVNKRSMASDKMVKLNGKEMTICEAVSQLNQLEGGVQFSCDDVSDRQFIEAMAKGGELERGTRTEREHIQVLKDLYSKRITPKQASKRIAKDHLKEDSRYYSKLAKMEGKMEDGGKMFDRETEDMLSEIHTKYAKGGKTNEEDKTINMKDYEGYADEFNLRKNDFLKANDEYQLLVSRGLEVKNNKDIPQEEKDKLLEELRQKAKKAKTNANEERQDLVNMREVKSPFYAPQLADGGSISIANKKAIDKRVGGSYKIKLKHGFFPKKGVDVIFYIDSQTMLGTLKFTIGSRNLWSFTNNTKEAIRRVMVEHLEIKPELFNYSVVQEDKSRKVTIQFLFSLTYENLEYIAMDVLKALTNFSYYDKIILNKNKPKPTPTPTPTPNQPKGLPSTDSSVWNGEFKIADVVRTRWDWSKDLGDGTSQVEYFSPTNNFQIVEIKENYALKREGNPTGKLYHLNNGQVWEGKDLELISDNSNLPQPKYNDQQVEAELMRWTAEKVKEKNGINSLKYQTSHLIRYILLNQAEAEMSDFDELVVLAKQSRKLSVEVLRLTEEQIPLDSFVMKLVMNKFLKSLEDVKTQIMLFVKYEDDVEQELGRVSFHIPYLADLDTFDKEYIINIK